MMTTALILAAAAAVLLVSFLLLRASIVRRVGRALAQTAATEAQDAGTVPDTHGRLDAAGRAWRDKQIDDKTLSRAAKIAGISAEEAARRLDAAGQTAVTPHRSNVERSAKTNKKNARRRKNKAASRSRQRNRK